jgi:hypothetical protein
VCVCAAAELYETFFHSAHTAISGARCNILLPELTAKKSSSTSCFAFIIKRAHMLLFSDTPHTNCIVSKIIQYMHECFFIEAAAAAAEILSSDNTHCEAE